MTCDDGIFYALRDGVGYLKLAGELRHTAAAPLDTLIDSVFDSDPPQVRAMVIDLTATQFMDSTMIGLLASIARELDRHGLPRATVFSTSAEINQLLSCLCLDSVFTVVPQPTDRPINPAELAAVVDCGRPAQDCAAIILKAHEALLDLSESNRQAFTPVVTLFRDQIGCGKR